MDTSGYTGLVEKTVLVETDDPAKPEFSLIVKAKIITPIDVFPKKVYFVGKKNLLLRRDVEIKANLDRTLEIRPISFDLKDKMNYEIKELEKGKRYKISFVKLPSDERLIKGTFKLETNYPEMRYIEIRIKGYFR